MLNGIIFNVIMPSMDALSVIKLVTIVLNATTQNVIMLNVVALFFCF
jgi:hypothetical protein